MWPADTMTPASVSARMIAGVVRSGASVTMVTPPVGVVSSRTALVVERAQLAGVVHAAAFVAEERAFDVDAEHARHALRDGIAHGLDGARDDVADHR